MKWSQLQNDGKSHFFSFSVPRGKNDVYIHTIPALKSNEIFLQAIRFPSKLCTGVFVQVPWFYLETHTSQIPTYVQCSRKEWLLATIPII